MESEKEANQTSGSETETKIVPPAGIKGAREVTPLYANISNVTAMGEVTRITFGEYFPEFGTKYYAAMVMPTEAALQLSELIQRMVAQNKSNIAALEETKKESTGE